jgi:protein-disulfide isomerase
LLGLWAISSLVAASLHNISYANLGPATASAAEAAPTDAQLKAALQKRLLVPDPAMITLGPPSPGPLAGMTQRTVTISNEQGQKIELKYFATGENGKGLVVQQYALVDDAHPWQRVELNKLKLDDRPTLGPAAAPLTIVEFADFECPFCARAFNEVENLVNNTYKGKVRLIWKNYPITGHAWAEQAAIAARCAYDQNPSAFWDFAQSLYRDQGEITPENLRQHIDQYAGAASLDLKAFNACLLNDKTEALVTQDKKDGDAIHVNSTPTFLINGVEVPGLPSSNVFDYVITSQLAEKSGGR